MLRTITAPCLAVPDATVQTWAITSLVIFRLPAQRHLLELEVIGLVLPYGRQVPRSAVAAESAVSATVVSAVAPAGAAPATRGSAAAAARVRAVANLFVPVMDSVPP
ncbi:hypothetical protein HII36_44665 [Nonomuraea sp. NN258]|nr:hypothetical protein [Nonomuraea antri]